MPRSKLINEHKKEAMLHEYIRKFPLEKITPTKLSKFFPEVPYHQWRDDQSIREKIDTINQAHSSFAISDLDISFPSVDEVMDNINKPRIMRRQVSVLIDSLIKLSAIATEAYHLEDLQKNHKIELDRKEKKIRSLSKQVETLQGNIDRLYIDSESARIARNKGIKSNLLSIDKNKSEDIKAVNTAYADILSSFSDILNLEDD